MRLSVFMLLVAASCDGGSVVTNEGNNAVPATSRTPADGFIPIDRGRVAFANGDLPPGIDLPGEDASVTGRFATQSSACAGGLLALSRRSQKTAEKGGEPARRLVIGPKEIRYRADQTCHITRRQVRGATRLLGLACSSGSETKGGTAEIVPRSGGDVTVILPGRRAENYVRCPDL